MPLDTPLSLFPNYLTPPIEGGREIERAREGGERRERRTSSNSFLLFFFFFWLVAFFNLKSSSSIRRHYPSHYALIKASSPAPTTRINVTIEDKVVVKKKKRKKKDINLTMAHWGLFSRRKNFRWYIKIFAIISRENKFLACHLEMMEGREKRIIIGNTRWKCTSSARKMAISKTVETKENRSVLVYKPPSASFHRDARRLDSWHRIQRRSSGIEASRK